MKKSLSRCADCPYKLGQIKTLVNPCIPCSKKIFKRFVTKPHGKKKISNA